MNRRYYLGWAVALAAVGIWAARAAWRVHKDIVSLHVRNLPLADVIRRLEGQTWEKIVTDSRLDTQVTLNVDNLPLADVLDRIAEQAGALMTTIHAVHDSRPALDKLLVALRSGDISKATGWTNVSPRLAVFNDESHPGETNPGAAHPGGERGRGQMVTVDRRVVVRRGPQGEGQTDIGGSAPFIRFRSARQGDGQSVQEEIIIPERIVMEAKLEARLKASAPLAPNHEAALAAARQVRGRCTTLYALRKSAAGSIGAGAMRRFRSEFSSLDSTKAGQTNARPRPPSIADAEREARRADLSRFLNLTPEQRAQRARERQEIDVQR